MAAVLPPKIMPTGYTPWDCYTILREAWAPYREFVIDNPPMNREEFSKTMHFAGYVNVAMHQGTTRVIVSVLNRMPDGGNQIIESTEKFKLFYHSMPTDISHVYMLSPSTFAPHVVSFIRERKIADNITRLDYNHFKIVVPHMPGNGQHRVLDEKQTQFVLETLGKNTPVGIGPIFSNDANIVWCGGVAGQLVQITIPSRVSGESVVYKRIVARSSY